jgi:hypothetical protein
MSEKDDGTHEIVKRQAPLTTAVPAQPRRTLSLGAKQEVDLTNLTDHEARMLEVKAAEKAIERDDRRERLKEDLSVTAAQIGTFAKAVNEVAGQEGAAVTITNTKDDSLGRTEMVFGNTDAARSGKLSRSQQGFGDNAKFWILIALIAGVVIVLIAMLNR